MTTISTSGAQKSDKYKIVYSFQDSNVTLTNTSGSGKSTDSTNFFKIYFPDKSRSSFIFTNDTGSTQYSTTNLYIYRLLHNNITGVTDRTSTIKGELVVELTSSTNNSKAYLCFLLENIDGTQPKPNDIDDILLSANVDKTLTVNMNSIIEKAGSCIEYSDPTTTSNSVFVFTKPINITGQTATTISTATNTNNKNGSSTSSGYDSTTTLFSINPTADKTYNIPESSIMRDGDNEVQIDCRPIERFQSMFEPFESNTVVEGATFMVPSKSTTAEIDRMSEIHKMTVYGCIFCMGILAICLIVPVVYKFMVVDKVIRLSKTNSDYLTKIEAITDKELTRIRTIDICISLFFMGLVGYFFYLGAVISTFYLAVGFFILFAFVVSFAVIQLKKGEYDFMKTVISLSSTSSRQYEKEEKEKEKQSFDILSGKDIFQFLTEIGKFIATKYTLSALVATEATFLFVMLILTYVFKQMTPSEFTSITVPVMIAVIPIGISLLMAIGIAPFPTAIPGQ
jgi:hypothetical protein